MEKGYLPSECTFSILNNSVHWPLIPKYLLGKTTQNFYLKFVFTLLKKYRKHSLFLFTSFNKIADFSKMDFGTKKVKSVNEDLTVISPIFF